MMQNEYNGHVCIYCKSMNVRNKLSQDFIAGEKLAKGYHPSIGTYMICTACGRTMIEHDRT